MKLDIYFVLSCIAALAGSAISMFVSFITSAKKEKLEKHERRRKLYKLYSDILCDTRTVIAADGKRVRPPMSCKNCGASLSSFQCEYCKTRY